ncbi:MAG: hypothetical protein IPI55_04490 [Flavobacteriales bacterium]|nr:hypothetical protein [Flavobacteriales bacterium]
MPGEGMPKILDPKSKEWNGLTLPWMAHGYSLNITPLQMLTFYNAVANKGRMMQPLFVERVERNGKVQKEYDPVVLNERTSDATPRKHTACWRVSLIRVLPPFRSRAGLRIAGKTGTARSTT